MEGRKLPPPPPAIPRNVVPIVAEETSLVQYKKASNPERLPMSRPGYGSKGALIRLQTNHFKVEVNKPNGHFFYYKVTRSSLPLLPYILCFQMFV